VAHFFGKFRGEPLKRNVKRRRMRTAIASTCFVLAALAFTYGVVTEYRQTRATGPIAIVATLPFALQAANFIALGLYLFPGSRPWWSYPLALVVSLITFGYATIRVSARH
jgi:hypothetical protein